MSCRWWVWFELAPVMPDLIVELHADVTVARLKGQSVYLYLLTCNLSLTGLTKPLASACCATQTRWKCEPWINTCIHKDQQYVQYMQGTHVYKKPSILRSSRKGGTNIYLFLTNEKMWRYVTMLHGCNVHVYMCASMHVFCVYVCFTESQLAGLIKNRAEEETKQWQNFSSSLSPLRLWLPISSH